MRWVSVDNLDKSGRREAAPRYMTSAGLAHAGQNHIALDDRGVRSDSCSYTDRHLRTNVYRRPPTVQGAVARRLGTQGFREIVRRRIVASTDLARVRRAGQDRHGPCRNRKRVNYCGRNDGPSAGSESFRRSRSRWIGVKRNPQRIFSRRKRLQRGHAADLASKSRYVAKIIQAVMRSWRGGEMPKQKSRTV